MNKTKRLRWRLVTIATVVFFLAAGAWFFIIPIQQSKRLEQDLIDRFDWATNYIPPANGWVEPGRLERFIRVRKAVQPNCQMFQNILENVIKLESLESDQEMSVGKKTSEGFESLKSMFSAAPAFLDFMDARNTALLAEEMGLGEYIYLYLAAYGPELAKEPVGRFADQEEAYLSPREQREFVRILENQLAAVVTSEPEAGSRPLAIKLRAEIAALTDGTRVSPWPDGPPGKTAESIDPYREQLASLYCEGIVRVEILQKKQGFNFSD